MPSIGIHSAMMVSPSSSEATSISAHLPSRAPDIRSKNDCHAGFCIDRNEDMTCLPSSSVLVQSLRRPGGERSTSSESVELGPGDLRMTAQPKLTVGRGDHVLSSNRLREP